MEQLQHYNVIDMFVVFTMAAGLLLGFWKGFAKTLTAIAAVVLGILAATKYHPAVEPYLSRVSLLDPNICTILSMIFLFILVQAIFVLIRKALDALLDFTRLGWLDRILGAGMGAGAGFLFLAATVQLLVLAVPEWPAVGTSKFVRPIEEISHDLMSRVPENVRSHFQRVTTKWKGALDTNVPRPSDQSESSKQKQSLIQGRVR